MMRVLAALALLCALALAPAAQAHKPSDSYLTLDVHGGRIDGQWDIALRDLDFAIGLDGDGDGRLTWGELRARHQAVAAYALQRLALSADGRPCPASAARQLVGRHSDGAYSVLVFHADCPAPVAVLTVDYRLFADLDPQHRGLLRIAQDGRSASAIFGPGQARQTLVPGAPDWLGQFGAYVRHGVWHIWIGADHILFLLSLLLPAVLLSAGAARPASLRACALDVLKVVTAFTLAHSITLSLATLSVLNPPSRWIEAAIAASVAVAALNNLFPLLGERRPQAAFAFGLIHGFGFAGVLAGLGLPRASLLLSLSGFNLGVEIGQLAIVAAILPPGYLLRHTRFYRPLLGTGSALIALLATVWFIERAWDVKLMSL